MATTTLKRLAGSPPYYLYRRFRRRWRGNSPRAVQRGGTEEIADAGGPLKNRGCWPATPRHKRCSPTTASSIPISRRYLKKRKPSTPWLKLSLGHFIHNQQLETLRDVSTPAAWRWWWKMTRPIAANWRQCSASKPPVNPSDAGDADFRHGKLAVGRRFAGRSRAPSRPRCQLYSCEGGGASSEKYRAVPPDQADARWLALLDNLPADAPRGIEFRWSATT